MRNIFDTIKTKKITSAASDVDER